VKDENLNTWYEKNFQVEKDDAPEKKDEDENVLMGVEDDMPPETVAYEATIQEDIPHEEADDTVNIHVESDDMPETEDEDENVLMGMEDDTPPDVVASEDTIQADIQHEEADDAVNIHLGVVVSPDEFTPENVAILKDNLIAKRSVKFCADQFDGRVVNYNVVGIDVMPDGITALLDEAIDDNGELNKGVYANSVNIVIDIGSGTTDMASIQGFDIIPDSERQFNVGTNDAFVDIAQEVERQFKCGYIETSQISNVVRFPLGVCASCGAVSATSKACTCGGTFEMKRNMIRIGQKVFDISDIVNSVFNDKAESVANVLKRYLDMLFKVRGINKSALDTILIVGGGSEMFGRLVKEKIAEFVGEYVEIKKVNRAIWKSVNGLGKYIVLKKGTGRKNFQRYVFVDVGNFATKAKMVDVDGKDVGKPIELMTKISTPVNQGSISLRKLHPMMDLHLDISTVDGESKIGDGTYFVSHLANKGKNAKVRNSLTPKTTDDLVYVMISSAISALVARDRTI